MRFVRFGAGRRQPGQAGRHARRRAADRADEVGALFAGFPGPWWLAGGYAIGLFVGTPFRQHGDINVVILRTDHRELHAALDGWDLWVADPPGSPWPWIADEILPATAHDIWCRQRRDGPWRLQVLVDELNGEY